jgi:hypothetical protein
MIPWEKDIYIGMLSNKIKEEQEAAKLREMQIKTRR